MFLLRLFRDKFDLLLTAGLFVLVLILYIQYAEGTAAKALEYILNSLGAAFFTLVGVRRISGGGQVTGDIDTANITQVPVTTDAGGDAESGAADPNTLRIITTERKVNTENEDTPKD